MFPDPSFCGLNLYSIASSKLPCKFMVYTCPGPSLLWCLRFPMTYCYLLWFRCSISTPHPCPNVRGMLLWWSLSYNWILPETVVQANCIILTLDVHIGVQFNGTTCSCLTYMFENHISINLLVLTGGQKVTWSILHLEKGQYIGLLDKRTDRRTNGWRDRRTTKKDIASGI